jgi:protein-S-isoprenylcysteine O-methyltransferase Ste14
MRRIIERMRNPHGLLSRLVDQRRRQEARMARTARELIGSEGRSRSSRRCRWFRDSEGIDVADEGFAPLRVVGICALWALVHSALASKRAKYLALRIAGQRYRDGLYRFAFNAQSILSLVWAALRFSRLPDRELYRVRPPWSWLFRASQVASLGMLLSGVRVMGVLRFAGLTPLRDLLTGKDVRPAPEAQGPPLGSDEEVVKAGAFRFSRHPGNLGALGFFVFMPRMTANRVVLLMLVGLYVVLGSLHEEHRLRAAYGAAYERYRRAVPFLIPGRPRG